MFSGLRFFENVIILNFFLVRVVIIIMVVVVLWVEMVGVFIIGIFIELLMLIVKQNFLFVGLMFLNDMQNVFFRVLEILLFVCYFNDLSLF